MRAATSFVQGVGAHCPVGFPLKKTVEGFFFGPTHRVGKAFQEHTLVCVIYNVQLLLFRVQEVLQGFILNFQLGALHND